MREFYRGREVVRVKDNASRDEFTVERRLMGDGVIDGDGLTVLDKPALGPNGKPLPPKEYTPLGTSASGSKPASKKRAESAPVADKK